MVGSYLYCFDQHGISGVLVRLQLLAVPVKEDGLCPEDQDNVVGVGTGADTRRLAAEELVGGVDLLEHLPTGRVLVGVIFLGQTEVSFSHRAVLILGSWCQIGN